jgi:hypothetical protein
VTLHNDVTPFADVRRLRLGGSLITGSLDSPTGGSHWLTPHKSTAPQDIHAAGLAEPPKQKWLGHAAVRLLPQRKLARFSFGQQATVDSPSPRG